MRYNYYAKGKQKMASYILLAIYIIFSSLGMVLIKSGASNSDISIKDNIFNMHVSLTFILGLLLYIVSFIYGYLYYRSFSTYIYITCFIRACLYSYCYFSFLILNNNYKSANYRSDLHYYWDFYCK